MTGTPPPLAAETTVGAWIAAAAVRLKQAGIERPLPEARTLLAAVLDVAPSTLFAYPERPLGPAAQTQADAYLARRAGGEPPGRILGVREFWSLPFRLSPDTLEPRPDTELIVETVLALMPNTPAPHILDLGVGSGCILLALLHEMPTATGLGIDRSLGALSAAHANAAALGLSERACFALGDWGAALPSECADIIVCNPPYIATETGPAPDAMTKAHDPALALYAGPDGLDAYHDILPDLARLLAPGGLAVLEIGIGQDADVRQIGAEAGLVWQETRPDLAGIPRAIIFHTHG